MLHPRFIGRALAFFLIAGCAFAAAAQPDTLHIYYHHTATTPHDTSLAKMDKWIKSLKGQKQELRIVGYYHKADFKKFAQERVDEMFLIVNRKARPLFDIKKMDTERGKDYQRTTVDLIYTPVGGPAASAGDKKENKSKADNEGKIASDDNKKQDNKRDDKTPGAKENKGKPAKGGDKPVTSTPAPGDKKPAVAKPQPETEEEQPEVSATEAAAEAFKSKTLVMVNMEEDPALIEKLQKKGDGDVSAYKSAVVAYNEVMKKTFGSDWKQSKVIFVPASESNAHAGENKLVVIPVTIEDEAGITFIRCKARLGDRERMFKVSQSGDAPSVADMLVLMHKIKIFYNLKSDFDRNGLEEKLQAATLLIPRDLNDVNEDQIRQAYPHGFSLLGSDELTKRADSREKVVYLRADVYDEEVNLLIVDAATGTIISRSAQTSKGKTKAATFRELCNENRQVTGVFPLTIY